MGDRSITPFQGTIFNLLDGALGRENALLTDMGEKYKRAEALTITKP
jgi:hypothetical protein